MKRPGEMKREFSENDTAPLYAGVKQMILDRIHSGEWPPKHRVPSENELVVGLGVSKMTANRALRELASEGELVRIQGVGSFVAERKGYSALFEVRNIADEIAERGNAHEAAVIVLAKETASPEVADALELEIGGFVFHSLIVHSENGVPVQIEDRFVNPSAARSYLEQDFSDAECLSHGRSAIEWIRARRRGGNAEKLGMQAADDLENGTLPCDPATDLVGQEDCLDCQTCLSGAPLSAGSAQRQDG